MATIPTILRGEDTAARGRSLAINLPEGDYTGLTIRLQWCGLERSWESPASGASLRFDLSAADTLPIPLGTHLGRLGVVLADGTGYIISEDIRIRVTDDVAEATGEANAIYISPADAAHALEIDLDGIEDEPATPDALRAAWKEFLGRLRAAVGVALVCVGLASTARAEGRVEVQTAASGSIPWGAQVVTNVTIEGELGLDGGAVTGIVERIVADATNAIPRGVEIDLRGDGSETVRNAALSGTAYTEWSAYGELPDGQLTYGLGLLFDEIAKHEAFSGRYPARTNIPALPASATVGELVDAFNAIANALRKEEP